MTIKGVKLDKKVGLGQAIVKGIILGISAGWYCYWTYRDGVEDGALTVARQIPEEVISSVFKKD